jgi:hypothetical protein
MVINKIERLVYLRSKPFSFYPFPIPPHIKKAPYGANKGHWWGL